MRMMLSVLLVASPAVAIAQTTSQYDMSCTAMELLSIKDGKRERIASRPYVVTYSVDMKNKKYCELSKGCSSVFRLLYDDNIISFMERGRGKSLELNRRSGVLTDETNLNGVYTKLIFQCDLSPFTPFRSHKF